MTNGLQNDRLGVTFLYIATLQLLNMIYVADQPPKSMGEKFVFSKGPPLSQPCHHWLKIAACLVLLCPVVQLSRERVKVKAWRAAGGAGATVPPWSPLLAATQWTSWAISSSRRAADVRPAASLGHTRQHLTQLARITASTNRQTQYFTLDF